MAVKANNVDDHTGKPVCPCCNGHGGHGYKYVLGAASPLDDDEDCTNCGGQGRTWFTDARPNTCTGYKALMRRVNR